MDDGNNNEWKGASTAHQVARLLLQVGAVVLRPNQPFRFTSGLLSPIYCDNRILISYPQERVQITRWFVRLLQEHAVAADVIAGTATAGIPHAAWLAAALKLPMVYVRSQAKGHGRERLVEGRPPTGQRVLVVEDLITTGGSAMGSVNALRQAGATVNDIVAIFGYDFPETRARFAQAGVQIHPLTTLPSLLEVAVADQVLTPEERTIVAEWATDPAVWSETRDRDMAS